jgi:hypothetical protein
VPGVFLRGRASWGLAGGWSWIATAVPAMLHAQGALPSAQRARLWHGGHALLCCPRGTDTKRGQGGTAGSPSTIQASTHLLRLNRGCPLVAFERERCRIHPVSPDPAPCSMPPPRLLPSDTSYDFGLPAATPAWRTPSGHLLVRAELDGKQSGYWLLDTGGASVSLPCSPAARDRVCLAATVAMQRMVRRPLGDWLFCLSVCLQVPAAAWWSPAWPTH